MKSTLTQVASQPEVDRVDCMTLAHVGIEFMGYFCPNLSPNIGTGP